MEFNTATSEDEVTDIGCLCSGSNGSSSFVMSIFGLCGFVPCCLLLSICLFLLTDLFLLLRSVLEFVFLNFESSNNAVVVVLDFCLLVLSVSDSFCAANNKVDVARW